MLGNALSGLRGLTSKTPNISTVESDGSEHLLWCFSVQTPSPVRDHLIACHSQGASDVSNCLNSSSNLLDPLSHQRS